MFKFFIHLIVLISLFNIDFSKTILKGQDKINVLRTLALEDPEYIIKLSTEDFKNFVETSPRPYDLLIMFVSEKISYCEVVYQSFKEAAQYYKETNTFLTTKDNGKLQRPLFFAKFSLNHTNTDIFKSYDFRTVPNLVLSTPKQLLYTEKIDKNMFLRNYLWEIRPEDGIITPYKLMVWINKKTERSIEYKEPMYTFWTSM